MINLRSDYQHYIAFELHDLTVKFTVDDCIKHLIRLSDDKLNYFYSKRLLLNIMASDEFASFLSSEFHKHMDDSFGRGDKRDLSSSPTVSEVSKGSTP